MISRRFGSLYARSSSLSALAARGRDYIGDLDVHGSGEHPAGWVHNPQYQLLKKNP